MSASVASTLLKITRLLSFTQMQLLLANDRLRHLIADLHARPSFRARWTGFLINSYHPPRLRRKPVLPRSAISANPAGGQEQVLEGRHRAEESDRCGVEVRVVGDVLSKVFVAYAGIVGSRLVPLCGEDVIVEDDAEVCQAEVLHGVDEAVLERRSMSIWQALMRTIVASDYTYQKLDPRNTVVFARRLATPINTDFGEEDEVRQVVRRFGREQPM